MKKKMSLKVEDLEERIAPSIATPGLPEGDGGFDDGVTGTTTAVPVSIGPSGAALWGVFSDIAPDPGDSDLSNVEPGNDNIGHFIPEE